MMAVASKNGIKADWILPFENLAIHGKIRVDMKEPGHHDGWGMVSYFPAKNMGGSADSWGGKELVPEYLEREPHSVTKDSQQFRNGAKLIEESKCRTAMVHFRKISVGLPQISNTHPFLHEEWVFAHNGTIFDSEKIPLTKFKPTGTTDSERFFLFLLERIAGLQEKKKQIEELMRGAEEIGKNFKHTSLTFLLTNGKNLFAYRECDPQYQDYYTLFLSEVAGGTLFCSEPLPAVSQNWKPLENGSLSVASF